MGAGYLGSGIISHRIRYGSCCTVGGQLAKLLLRASELSDYRPESSFLPVACYENRSIAVFGIRTPLTAL